MNNILLFLSLCIVTSFLIPMSKKSHWFVRGFDYIKIHLIILGLIIIFLWSIIGFTSFVSVLSFTLLTLIVCVQLYQLKNYFKLEANTAKVDNFENIKQEALNILSFNVRQKNTNYHATENFILKTDPDIILLIEVDKKWCENINNLKKRYKYKVEAPNYNTYGMSFYSKFEIIDSNVKFLVENNVTSIFATVRLKNNKKIKLICIHPRPPRVKVGSSKLRNAEFVSVTKLIEKNRLPLIVLGDFNDVPWSSSFKSFLKVNKLNDPRQGRGILASFPAIFPPLGYPIDHILHCNQFLTTSFKVLENVGSDHRPISATLSYKEKLSVNVLKQTEAVNI